MSASNLPFVGSNQEGASFEKVMVFVEVIPRDGMNEVRKAIDHASDQVHTVNDAVGYERLNDAIIDAQGIGSRILDYVEAENLFFAFGESVEALRDALRHFPLPEEFFQPSPSIYGDLNEQEGRGDKKKNPNNKAIVLCKLRKANGLLDGISAKKQESARYADCRQVTWGELQELKDKIKHRCDAELSEFFCKAEGAAK